MLYYYLTDSGTFQTSESRSTQTNPEQTKNLLIQLAMEFEAIVQENPELNQFPLLEDDDDDMSSTPWNPGTTNFRCCERESPCVMDLDQACQNGGPRAACSSITT